jgi:hypothetical protein
MQARLPRRYLFARALAALLAAASALRARLLARIKVIFENEYFVPFAHYAYAEGQQIIFNINLSGSKIIMQRDNVMLIRLGLDWPQVARGRQQAALALTSRNFLLHTKRMAPPHLQPFACKPPSPPLRSSPPAGTKGV